MFKLAKRVQGATCARRKEYIPGSSGKLLCVGNCLRRSKHLPGSQGKLGHHVAGLI